MALTQFSPRVLNEILKDLADLSKEEDKAQGEEKTTAIESEKKRIEDAEKTIEDARKTISKAKIRIDDLNKQVGPAAFRKGNFEYMLHLLNDNVADDPQVYCRSDTGKFGCTRNQLKDMAPNELSPYRMVFAEEPRIKDIMNESCPWRGFVTLPTFQRRGLENLTVETPTAAPSTETPTTTTTTETSTTPPAGTSAYDYDYDYYDDQDYYDVYNYPEYYDYYDDQDYYHGYDYPEYYDRLR